MCQDVSNFSAKLTNKSWTSSLLTSYNFSTCATAALRFFNFRFCSFWIREGWTAERAAYRQLTGSCTTGHGLSDMGAHDDYAPT
jgi:hypothetical protein